MKIPKNKWRELLLDPFALDLGANLVLDQVLGYPPAGNDVLLCRGQYKGQAVEFYLKLPRHKDANFANEAAALVHLAKTPIPAPKVLAFGQYEEAEYLAITSEPGKRMSGNLVEAEWQSAKSNIQPFLVKIAGSLANIHALNLDWPPVNPRTQFFIPSVVDVDHPAEDWLKEQIFWLEENKPEERSLCFVHGDHHYANLLWLEGVISAVLDWELCGIGWREFDIAWAILPRPGQKFLNTLEQHHIFLDAYQAHHAYDRFAVAWCLTLITVHFLSLKSMWAEREFQELLMGLCAAHIRLIE